MHVSPAQSWVIEFSDNLYDDSRVLELSGYRRPAMHSQEDIAYYILSTGQVDLLLCSLR